MNWSAVGAVAELLGAVGVIVTLLYLATQIRQNTRASQAAAHQSLIEASATMNAMVGTNPEVARLFTNAFRSDLDSLDLEEQIRFRFVAGQWLLTFEAVFMQYELGTIRQDYFEAKMKNLENMLRGPGVRRVWDRSEEEYTPRFREYVSKNLLDADAQHDDQ